MNETTNTQSLGIVDRARELLAKLANRTHDEIIAALVERLAAQEQTTIPKLEASLGRSLDMNHLEQTEVGLALRIAFNEHQKGG
jgi:hypothetical protein